MFANREDTAGVWKPASPRESIGVTWGVRGGRAAGCPRRKQRIGVVLEHLHGG
jgi:hypothetical protein